MYQVYRILQIIFSTKLSRNFTEDIMQTYIANKFSCTSCEKQFATKGNLKAHILSIHENIRFPCKQCDYKATHSSSLKAHIRSIHENIKFPCQQCDDKATTRSDK